MMVQAPPRVPTVDERQVAVQVLARAIAPESLEAYVYATFAGHYDMAPHHRKIIEALEAVEAGQCDRLMIFMPPQRGKSELASIRFPAWWHGRNPDKSIIACSYGDHLAGEFSRQVRDQLQDAETWPFPGVSAPRGDASRMAWGIEGHAGRHIAAGVGSGITGRGAHLLLIDDPIKSRAEAYSITYRELIWNWYTHDARSRLRKRGAVVLIQTRWHEDDLGGRLLERQGKGGDRWEVLRLKEMAEEGDVDPLGRAPGDVLWPAQFPAEETAEIRDTTPYVWHPLYQQRPGALRGNLFRLEWFSNRYDPRDPPEWGRCVQLVDAAFEQGVGRSYSADVTWAECMWRGKSWIALIDVWREQVEFPELENGVVAAYEKWRHLKPKVYIEKKASGHSLLQTLRRRKPIIPALPWMPGSHSSKVTRAEDSTPFFAASRILLPELVPGLTDWVTGWINEHLVFPAGMNNDLVDTTSMMADVLARRPKISGRLMA